jgi:hypothetical protein
MTDFSPQGDRKSIRTLSVIVLHSLPLLGQVVENAGELKKDRLQKVSTH